jgi:hypothetical protein
MSKNYINLLTEKVFAKSGLGKWFNRESAGGGPGWDRYNTKGERVGKCGDAEEGASYSACLSKQKAKLLGKEKIGEFVRRKRAAQKKAGRGKKGEVSGKGKKPVYVETGVQDLEESKKLTKRRKKRINPRTKLEREFKKEKEEEQKLLGDLDNSGSVSGADLGIMLGDWDTDNELSDLNGDGVVSGADLGILLGQWGQSLPESNIPVFVSVGNIVLKDTKEYFIAEGASSIFEMKFSKIKAKELLPCDVIINESGQIFEVDHIEKLNEKYFISLIDENGNEINETFIADVTMGFVDNIEDSSYNEYGDKISVYEEENKKIKLNKIMRGDVKKYKVYVRNDRGNVVKVNFGDPNMEIKRDDPARRKNFRARHNCNNPGPRWKARYWACKTWSSTPVSSMLKEEVLCLEEGKKNKAKNPKKWSSCIAQAKKKFDVYPSAYANAWAAKCYKGKGGKWKAVSEDIADNIMNDINSDVYSSTFYELMEKITKYNRS